MKVFPKISFELSAWNKLSSGKERTLSLNFSPISFDNKYLKSGGNPSAPSARTSQIIIYLY